MSIFFGRLKLVALYFLEDKHVVQENADDNAGMWRWEFDPFQLKVCLGMSGSKRTTLMLPLEFMKRATKVELFSCF